MQNELELLENKTNIAFSLNTGDKGIIVRIEVLSQLKESLVSSLYMKRAQITDHGLILIMIKVVLS